MAYSGVVKIVKAAPRDGFRILPSFVPADEKIALTESLLEAGCDEAEASSFASGERAPQFGDAEEIRKYLQSYRTDKRTKITYPVPNAMGAERTVAAGARA